MFYLTVAKYDHELSRYMFMWIWYLFMFIEKHNHEYVNRGRTHVWSLPAKLKSNEKVFRLCVLFCLISWYLGCKWNGLHVWLCHCNMMWNLRGNILFHLYTLKNTSRGKFVASCHMQFINVKYKCYYSGVIMSTMASQINGVSMVCQLFVRVWVKDNIKAPRHWP